MNELTVSRFIDASQATVWDVMTNRIEEWWCPAPWRAEIVEQDWCAGGRTAMVFKGPDGEEMPQEGFFLEVIPGVRFVTTDACIRDENGAWQPSEPFMIGIWEIGAEGNGTRFTATARHWTREAAERHVAMGFETGWGAAAEQLKALCEN